MNNQETWKQIPSFPTYAASNFGRIKNIKRNTIIKQNNADNREYKIVSISYKNKPYTKRVARLIWEAFNGCPCGLTIDHIDGNVSNNNINNLDCISGKENNGKRDIYRKKNKYKLNDTLKTEILTKYLNGTSVYKLSFEYNIPSNYLYTTFSRGSWKHLCWKDDTQNTETSLNA